MPFFAISGISAIMLSLSLLFVFTSNRYGFKFYFPLSDLSSITLVVFE